MHGGAPRHGGKRHPRHRHHRRDVHHRTRPLHLGRQQNLTGRRRVSSVFLLSQLLWELVKKEKPRVHTEEGRDSNLLELSILTVTHRV